MIKYTSNKQIAIEDFILPFAGELSKENRWVKLALELPWDDMVKVYLKNMSQKHGRKAVNPRIAIGALIIKQMKSLTDEGAVEEIRENPYLQYFLGNEKFSYEAPFTPSLFVSFRNRLGKEEFDALTDALIVHVKSCLEKRGAGKKEKSNKGGKDGPEPKNKNKGHLIIDASVTPADIKYPTDLDLLNDAREKSGLLIDLLHKKGLSKEKPRTYRREAHKEYLKLSKQRRKSKQKIRAGLRKQLNYLRRNIGHIETLLDRSSGLAFPLSFKHQRVYWIIQEVYRQQKLMYETKTNSIVDRIVSISQPHVRPIVRGKSGRNVEFGAKISISVVNGFTFLNRLGWDAYNEAGDLRGQVGHYNNTFGYYPEWVGGDKIYGCRENRKYLEGLGIKFSGNKLGRPSLADRSGEKERKKKARQRSEVEGKFGESKRSYSLDCVMAKRAGTSESWIGSVFFVMNIAHWMRVILLSFFERGIFRKKLQFLIEKIMINERFGSDTPHLSSSFSTF